MVVMMTIMIVIIVVGVPHVNGANVTLRTGFWLASLPLIGPVLALSWISTKFSIDRSRAERLSWIPEILRAPHEIWEPNQKKTADEMFIREYDKSGTPFRAVLLKIDQTG